MTTGSFDVQQKTPPGLAVEKIRDGNGDDDEAKRKNEDDDDDNDDNELRRR